MNKTVSTARRQAFFLFNVPRMLPMPMNGLLLNYLSSRMGKSNFHNCSSVGNFPFVALTLRAETWKCNSWKCMENLAPSVANLLFTPSKSYLKKIVNGRSKAFSNLPEHNLGHKWYDLLFGLYFGPDYGGLKYSSDCLIIWFDTNTNNPIGVLKLT